MMSGRKSVILCSIFWILIFGFWIPPKAHARPLKGFYEGPYLTLSAGLMQFNWDVNQRTGMQEANNWQTMLHLGFGWNLSDWFAPELQMRFGTDSNWSRREYISGANLGFNFILLADPLLNFKKWRILPFIKPGFVFQPLFLPGDPSVSNTNLRMIGYGGSAGGGVRFLFHEYLYLGVEVEEDFVNHTNKFQVLSGNDTLIYPGGWKKQFEALTMVGVHF